METVTFKKGFTIFLLGVVVLSLWGVQWKTLDADFTELDDLQPGDIIFVDIYEGWSHGGFWDHIALYIGDNNYGRASVVESTFNGGIILSSARTVVTRNEPAKVAVRRLKETEGNAEDIQKVVDYALAQIDKPFDYTAWTGFPLKLNEKNLSCVEIVWRAYKAAGIDLDVDDGILVFPDDIYFSPKLTEID